jgi:hypothetical protein
MERAPILRDAAAVTEVRGSPTSGKLTIVPPTPHLGVSDFVTHGVCHAGQHTTNLAIYSGLSGISNAGALTLERSAVASGYVPNILNNGTMTIRNSSVCCEVWI